MSSSVNGVSIRLRTIFGKMSRKASPTSRVKAKCSSKSALRLARNIRDGRRRCRRRRARPRGGEGRNSPPPISRSADRRSGRGRRRRPAAGHGRLGVFLIGNGRVEVGSAAEPALGGRQEPRVHMDGGHMRVGHVRDQADPGGEEAGVFLGAVNAGGEFGREASADGRDVHADFLEDLAAHLPADAAAARAAFGVGALPRDELEARLAAGLALDLLEGRTDAVAQRFEPVAGALLLFVECQHGAHITQRARMPIPPLGSPDTHRYQARQSPLGSSCGRPRYVPLRHVQNNASS